MCDQPPNKSLQGTSKPLRVLTPLSSSVSKMMLRSEPLEINGTQPSIEGSVCEELIAVQYWHAGELEDPANVIHLRFNGTWYRLYFDHGIIYWRQDDTPPEAFEAKEIDSSYRLDDIACSRNLRGKTLLSIQSEAIPGGSKVTFEFDSGSRLEITNANDRTNYTC